MTKKHKTAKRASKASSHYWLKAADLREKDVCQAALNKFVRAFGEAGGPINLANATKAARMGLEMTWVFNEYRENYDAEDYYYDTALPAARRKYPNALANAKGVAFMATLAKYPLTGLMTTAASKAQGKAIEQIKALIKKHGVTPAQLGYDVY